MPHAVVFPPPACVQDWSCTKLLVASATVSQNSHLGHCAVSVHFMVVCEQIHIHALPLHSVLVFANVVHGTICPMIEAESAHT